MGASAVIGGTDVISPDIPRQKFIDPALPVAVDDGGERVGQIGLRINSIEFACLDQRGDCRPILSLSVVPRPFLDLMSHPAVNS